MREVIVGKEKEHAGYKYQVLKDKKTGQVLYCGKIRGIRKMAKLNNWILFENGQVNILGIVGLVYLGLMLVVLIVIF